MDQAVSVVVPVKNEAANIAPLLDEIHGALEDGTTFEVIYVDDGSDDGTADALAMAAVRYPRLRVVRHARSCGQSTAVHTGAKFARYPWIATLDGDGQNDPADIPALLAAAAQAAQRQRGARSAQTFAPNVLIAGHRVNRNDTSRKGR
jgi:dolichol-phosphate mannosyltransferase